MKALVIWCALVMGLTGAAAASPAALSGPAQPASAPPAGLVAQDLTPRALPPLDVTDPAPEPARRIAMLGSARAASAARSRYDDDLSQEPRPGLLLLAGLAALLFMAARHSS